MAAYIVANYRVTNPEAFKAYAPSVLPTLLAHGAEVLVADVESEAIEGEPARVTIVTKFPSKEAARAWYDSAEYQEVIHLRTNNSEGFITLTNEFVMPE